MTSFSLTQVVDSPTHFSPSGQPSRIDLVFVSNLYCLSMCSVIPQLANSDHLGLLVNLKYHSTSSIPPYRRCVWRITMLTLNELTICCVMWNLKRCLIPPTFKLAGHASKPPSLTSWSNASLGLYCQTGKTYPG